MRRLVELGLDIGKSSALLLCSLRFCRARLRCTRMRMARNQSHRGAGVRSMPVFETNPSRRTIREQNAYVVLDCGGLMNRIDIVLTIDMLR